MRKLFRGSTVLLAVAVLGVTAMIVSGATAGTKKKGASVQVCVLLPDTKSSVRWVQFDAPDFAKAFKAAGVTASITNALNDPQKQKAQASGVPGRRRQGRHRDRARQRLGLVDREAVHLGTAARPSTTTAR